MNTNDYYGQTSDWHNRRARFLTKLNMSGRIAPSNLPSIDLAITSLACVVSHYNQFRLARWLQLNRKHYAPIVS